MNQMKIFFLSNRDFLSYDKQTIWKLAIHDEDQYTSVIMFDIGSIWWSWWRSIIQTVQFVGLNNQWVVVLLLLELANFAIRKLPSLLVREDNTWFICHLVFMVKSCCVAQCFGYFHWLLLIKWYSNRELRKGRIKSAKGVLCENCRV